MSRRCPGARAGTLALAASATTVCPVYFHCVYTRFTRCVLCVFAGKYFNCTGGVTNYLEQQMFSKKRVYMFPYVQWTYLGGPFDHEGLISCMNGLLVTYIGAQAAWIYLYHASHWARIGVVTHASFSLLIDGLLQRAGLRGCSRVRPSRSASMVCALCIVYFPLLFIVIVGSSYVICQRAGPTQNDGVIPFNRQLFSLSYCLIQVRILVTLCSF